MRVNLTCFFLQGADAEGCKGAPGHAVVASHAIWFEPLL
jgi:hypothetical protein